MGEKLRDPGPSTLELEARRILAPYQVRCRATGESLECSHCGRNVPYTYRTLCGECFLAGRRPRLH